MVTCLLELHAMQPVIYDVAVSMDGFIAGPGGDISRFAHEGPVVDDYFARLKTYPTAIMGRATYEFGYRHGLRPGQNPYPWMRTIVFSATLDLPAGAQVEVAASRSADIVADLKAQAQAPIYLCGGGVFAASLMDHGLIDRIRLKRAPVLLGGGVALLTPIGRPMPDLRLDDQRDYTDGYLYQDFAVT